MNASIPGMADTPEYQARIQSYSEGKNLLDMQREAPRILRELIADAPGGLLRRRPAPEKWSVGEILAHMAEDEIVSSWRYRQMLEQDGCALNGFDQDAWARLGRYPEWNPTKALELFELLREVNLRMLSGLSSGEWQRKGIHAERGEITVEALARHMAGHDINHIEQIRKILDK